MELLESTASRHVTAEWLVKFVINQQEIVRLVADRVLLAMAARYVSSINSVNLSMHSSIHR